MSNYLDDIKWNQDGLVAAIAQDNETGEVLMMAWMNRESLELTENEGIAIYWSRSRKKLWRKGESSGHTQKVKAIQLDCDGDAILLRVEQVGGIACHTGRRSCFYRSLEQQQWAENASVLRNPEEIYK